MSPGHLIFRSAAVTPLRVSARLARLTRPSLDSLISQPVRVLWRTFLARIERFLMLLPLIVTAAYELPPSAMNTARVDITLA